MASEDYKESEISKIVKRLMDEEGFEFGEAVKEAMEQTKNFESKADGGSIGIEVLFTDKMKDGGRVPMVSGGALKAIGSGIMKLFSKGDDAADLAKQEEIFRSGNITTDFLENVDDKVIEKFIRTRDTGGVGGYGMYDSFAEMPNGLKAAELISRIKTADGGINYEAAELFIGKKLKGDESVDELISMVITEKKADGGRVGLFMGGPALEGQALAIYNSMKAYGEADQAIADRLQSLGYYTPGGSTPDTPDQGIINQQLNQGGGDGPKGDFGIFGNLLKDTAKEFNVQFYDEEYGDFIDTPVTGYKNVNTGLYQDKFGKNLQPMFSNKGQAFGLSGIIAQALGLTPDTVGGYVPGSVKGKYDGVTDMFSSLKNFKIKNPFNFFKKQQATNAEIAAANLKAKQELEAKLAAAAALKQQMQDTGVTGSNYNQAANIAGGGGGNTATYRGQTAREATYDNDPSTGTSQGYSQHYARGGLATMFTRRR